MEEENRDIETRTHTEEADDYIKKLQREMEDSSDAEKVSFLLEKTRYWYWSAIDWRSFYEIVLQREKKEVSE